VQLATPMCGMYDVRLVSRLAAQDDIISWWQVRDLDRSRRQIHYHATRLRWREIHRGVYAACHGELTQRRLWWAATLTAPGTWLNAFSAANAYGYHLSDLGCETVVRAGSGGKLKLPGLLIARSTTLDGHVGTKAGIAIVSPERALIEISASLGESQRGRAFRESIRLRTTTADGIAKVLAGQRGTAALAALCDRYAKIPYHRCRSDAESRALEVFWDAGIPIPLVNMPFRGPRPDFRWAGPDLIIEIDSKEFHQFPDVDAGYQATWEAGGARVRRFPAARVYSHPHELVALYHANVRRLDP